MGAEEVGPQRNAISVSRDDLHHRLDAGGHEGPLLRTRLLPVSSCAEAGQDEVPETLRWVEDSNHRYSPDQVSNTLAEVHLEI